MTLDALSQFAVYTQRCNNAFKEKTKMPNKLFLKLATDDDGNICLRAVQTPNGFIKKLGFFFDRVFHKNQYKLPEISSFLVKDFRFEDKNAKQVKEGINALDEKIRKYNQNHPKEQVRELQTQKKFKSLLSVSPSPLVPAKPNVPVSTESALSHSKRSSLQVEVDMEKAKINDIENDFFLTMYNNREHHNFLQMVVINNVGDESKKAGILVDFYLDKTSSSVSESQKKALKDQLTQHLKADPHPKTARRYELESHKILEVFPTRGDGSCGLHALVGTSTKGSEYKCDASKVRKELVNELTRMKKDNELPPEIRIIITDYFLEADDPRARVPQSFRKNSAVDKFRRENFGRYQELTRQHDALQKSLKAATAAERVEIEKQRKILNEQRDQIKNNFIDNDAVFEAYLGTIKNTRQYLLQDELLVAAQILNKQIVLFQPGWGHEMTKLRHEVLNAEATGDVVYIYYNGNNHYERAQVVAEA